MSAPQEHQPVVVNQTTGNEQSQVIAVPGSTIELKKYQYREPDNELSLGTHQYDFAQPGEDNFRDRTLVDLSVAASGRAELVGVHFRVADFANKLTLRGEISVGTADETLLGTVACHLAGAFDAYRSGLASQKALQGTAPEYATPATQPNIDTTHES